MLAERELCVDPLLERCQSQLLQPACLDPRERLVGDVRERGPAPKIKRAVELGQRLVRLPSGVRLTPPFEVLLEAVNVDVAELPP